MQKVDKIKSIIIDDESHWQLIIKKLVNNISDLSLEAVFSDVEEAYDYLLDHDIDLIFLDMQINGDNGIDLIKRLHKTHTVIIISATSEYAFEGFSISAIDYLKKPIEFEKFDRAVQKAIQQIRLKEITITLQESITFNKDYFLIKDDSGIVKLYHNEVLYISALENYIKIFTAQKTYLVLTTLLQFERSLQNHPFLRVHRSHLVNLNSIKIIGKETLTLSNDAEISIGDIYRNAIHEVFIEGKLVKR